VTCCLAVSARQRSIFDESTRCTVPLCTDGEVCIRGSNATTPQVCITRIHSIASQQSSFLVAGFHTRFAPPLPFLTTMTVYTFPNPPACFSRSRSWDLGSVRKTCTQLKILYSSRGTFSISGSCSTSLRHGGRRLQAVLRPTSLPENRKAGTETPKKIIVCKSDPWPEVVTSNMAGVPSGGEKCSVVSIRDRYAFTFLDRS
jgi:hypothetical protein